jgi:2-amino-4-hydroxy-6-hydroxymethyldihydropteridine diphosphokinase
VGDRKDNINGALASLRTLPGARVVACSSLHETKAWGPVAQGDYLNAACVIETGLTPVELLAELHMIERAHGRDRAREVRFGPRSLDLDILLFEGVVLEESALAIPHPRLHERLFVLRPLAEIAPNLVHPVLRKTVRELLEELVRSQQ